MGVAHPMEIFSFRKGYPAHSGKPLLIKEGLLFALVGWGIFNLLQGQKDLPLLWGDMLGAMAACYPLNFPQRLAYIQGETLPFLWILLTGHCRFDPLVVRFPAILAGALTLILGAFAKARERPYGERLFFTLLMMGTPAFLFYSHVTRPYEYVLLGGTAAWIYRKEGERALTRSILCTLAVLGVPFSAPLYAAVLLREFFCPLRKPRSPLRTFLIFEILLATAALGWEIFLLIGPAHPLLMTWMKVRGIPSLIPGKILADLLDLVGFSSDPLGWASFLFLLILGVLGLLTSPRDLTLMSLTGLLYFLALLLFKPQATARFFLGIYPPLLLLAFEGWKRLRILGSARFRTALQGFLLVGIGILLCNFLRVQYVYTRHTPDLYFGVELRPPVTAILKNIQPGDIVLGDESWFLDQLYLPVFIHRPVEFWIFRSGFHPPFTEPWLGGDPYRWKKIQGLPWLKLVEVRIFSEAEELLRASQEEIRRGRRLVSLGFLSGMPHLCSQPCPELSKTPSPHLVVIRDGILNPRDLPNVCNHKVAIMGIAEKKTGWEIFFSLVPLYPDLNFTKTIRRSLCPE